MNLNECIEKMTKKEIDSLYKKYNVSDIVDLENIITIENCEKIHYLTDEELNCLTSELNSQDIPSYLIDNNLVLKVKDKYVVCDEVIKNANESLSDSSFKRKSVIVNFYLNINGCMPIKELMRLCRKTGIKITLNDINRILEDSNYYLVDNLIVSDRSQDPCSKSGDYYVFDIHEKENIILFMYSYYPYLIETLLEKYIPSDFEDFGLYIVKLIIDGIFYEISVSEVLYTNNIKLPKSVLNEFKDLVTEAMVVCPCSLYKGKPYCILEGNFTDEEYYKYVDNVNANFISQITATICAYLLVNNILPKEKFCNILSKKHHIYISDGLLYKIINSLTCVIRDGYIMPNDDSAFLPNLREYKEKIGDYKYIPDHLELTSNYNKKLDKVKNVCKKYGIDEEKAYEFNILLTIGIYKNKDIYNYFREDLEDIIPKGMEDKLFKELDNIIIDMPCWIYNGYSYKEIKGRL